MIKKYIFSLSIDSWVIIIGSLISLSACIVFYNLNLHLSNYDALSRMNIARKITDNLKPGLAQFGSVWPFLPQLIMMPFTAITPLWHTGIAGMIMSAPSYVLSGYLVYLIVLEITKSKYSSIIGFLIFMTNINLLLLQTMAMSETLFICLTLGAMYGLLRWMRNPISALFPLVLAGGCLAGASLVRYEGVAFSVAAIIVVSLVAFIKIKDIKATEGITIFFSTVTLFGIFVWCLYSALIFKDPLYWEKVYTGQTTIISTDVRRSLPPKPRNVNLAIKNFELKSLTYIYAIADLSGIPIFFIGCGSFLVFIFYIRPWRDQKSFVILLPLAIVLFMFLTFYVSSLPIIAPSVSWKNILAFKTNYVREFNIRYGILLWPFIVIMISWLTSRKKFLKILGVIILLINILTPLDHKAFLIYQLPLAWNKLVTDKGSVEYSAKNWLKSNYTGGLILISALKHDPIMFQLGFPYKTYIHEGTGKYWLTSIKHPEVYAEWIFIADPRHINGSTVNEPDLLTEILYNNPSLTKYYVERYNDSYIDIYKRRTNYQDIK